VETRKACEMWRIGSNSQSRPTTKPNMQNQSPTTRDKQKPFVKIPSLRTWLGAMWRCAEPVSWRKKRSLRWAHNCNAVPDLGGHIGCCCSQPAANTGKRGKKAAAPSSQWCPRQPQAPVMAQRSTSPRTRSMLQPHVKRILCSSRLATITSPAAHLNVRCCPVGVSTSSV